jgi:hypothetical protein
MLTLRKLLKLPSPVDLGWSEYNALEDEEFSENPKGKTWQDWHRTVKQMHPVKYWIAETFGDWLRYKVWLRITRPIKDAHYWLVSHLVPSRRYHMLDLRQPGGYQYGWRDVPEKMLYAMFNLLGEYLNEEQPHDLTQWYTREQIEADLGMKRQQEAIEEARAIYHWWTVEQHQELARKNEMLTKWSEARKAKDPKKEEYWNQLRQMDSDFDAKEDEMIARLMKIRRTLWT